MAPLNIRLGHKVRELRAAAGYSQEAFAAAIKVHRTFMGTIERGNTNVSLETLERIAGGLGIHVWELIKQAETGSMPAADQSTKDRAGKRRPTYSRRSAKDDDAPPSRKVAE